MHFRLSQPYFDRIPRLKITGLNFVHAHRLRTLLLVYGHRYHRRAAQFPLFSDTIHPVSSLPRREQLPEPFLTFSCVSSYLSLHPKSSSRGVFAVRLWEGDPEDVVIVLRKVDLHAVAQILRQLGVVALIGLWEDDVLDARAARGDELLAHAADGEHATREGELPRHRQVGARRHVHGKGEEGGDHRDAGRRAVLRCRTLGHMHVQRRCLEKVVLRLQLVEVAACKRVRNLRALAHDVAHLSGAAHCGAATALGIALALAPIALPALLVAFYEAACGLRLDV
mmetsp:Transcript_36001/g.79132  ORF Transcript_36001/g.79132 Transcript_36001/m.79132 type:complete len:282 (-) Transcript_36001:111-956(-)